MVEWFNEWQSFPNKLEVTPENMILFLKSRGGLSFSLKNIEDDELEWLFFFGSMLKSSIPYLSDASPTYENWIREKMEWYGEFPRKGLNNDMAHYILHNYKSNFQKPFNLGSWAWHNEIMFMPLDSPLPSYPPLRGISNMIPFINWMWDSPFTLK